MLHLRHGGVRRPHGIQSLPLPISQMYKSAKWWAESEAESKSLVKAQKAELGINFKEQLEQVWKVSPVGKKSCKALTLDPCCINS